MKKGESGIVVTKSAVKILTESGISRGTIREYNRQAIKLRKDPANDEPIMKAITEKKIRSLCANLRRKAGLSGSSLPIITVLNR